MAFPPKTILVFCDGTGQDGLITDKNPLKKDANHFTNVLRLCRATQQTFDEGPNKRLQIVFYQSGVGVSMDFEGEEGMTDLDIKAQKALGTAVASKVRDAYNFIAQNYMEGDRICIFGFSRGAYTARKLSGLIDRLGLLTPTQMGNFFTYWKQLNNIIPGDPPHPTKAIPIKCVGTWDTVGTVYNKLNALKLIDTKLPSNVELALHAVAFHENRDKFLCTLYSGVAGSNQVLKQVWFPGAHSDVGGGYRECELADISLAWMVGEIKSFIGIDEEFVKASMSNTLDSDKEECHWGKAKPKDAYDRTSMLEGKVLAIRKRDRLVQLTPDVIIHPSLIESPSVHGLITLAQLREKIGWKDENHIIPLNEYEQHIQEFWFDRGKGEGEEVPVFEGLDDMEDLF